jgi:hypothetical protein
MLPSSIVFGGTEPFLTANRGLSGPVAAAGECSKKAKNKNVRMGQEKKPMIVSAYIGAPNISACVPQGACKRLHAIFTLFCVCQQKKMRQYAATRIKSGLVPFSQSIKMSWRAKPCAWFFKGKFKPHL